MSDQPSEYIPEGVSLSESLILERRERAARTLSIEARWKGDIVAVALLERYEKSARYMAECASRGIPFLRGDDSGTPGNGELTC